MRDSGINHVVFHFSWLSIFSHRRNQLPRSTKASKGHSKGVCGGRKSKSTDTLRVTLGNPISPVAMIYVEWVIWEGLVNELFLCN